MAAIHFFKSGSGNSSDIVYFEDGINHCRLGAVKIFVKIFHISPKLIYKLDLLVFEIL